jgi:hypothetical protein
MNLTITPSFQLLLDRVFPITQTLYTQSFPARNIFFQLFPLRRLGGHIEESDTSTKGCPFSGWSDIRHKSEIRHAFRYRRRMHSLHKGVLILNISSCVP